MTEKYSIETHISVNPQSWFGIENIFREKNDCTCLYISYFQNHLHLWILKTSGVLHHRKISTEENLVQAGLPKDLPLSKFLADNFRSLGILPIEDCEDRSLNMVELQPLSPSNKRAQQDCDSCRSTRRTESFQVYLCVTNCLLPPFMICLRSLKSLLFLIAVCTKFPLLH